MLSFPRALATSVFTSLILLACVHPALAGPGRQKPSLRTDQVNTEGWDTAWTNLVNDVQQTFTPSLPVLTAVEVELVVGNPGPEEDQLTLSVLDASGKEIATVTQDVPVDDADQVLFLVPNNGVAVTPGQKYRIKLSGGTTFGWKYVVGGYKKGSSTFNGKPLLPGARSSFLFRTFGAN